MLWIDIVGVVCVCVCALVSLLRRTRFVVSLHLLVSIVEQVVAEYNLFIYSACHFFRLLFIYVVFFSSRKITTNSIPAEQWLRLLPLLRHIFLTFVSGISWRRRNVNWFRLPLPHFGGRARNDWVLSSRFSHGIPFDCQFTLGLFSHQQLIRLHSDKAVDNLTNKNRRRNSKRSPLEALALFNEQILP